MKKKCYHIIHTTISPCENERRIFNEVISAEKSGYRVKILALHIPGIPEKDVISHSGIFRLFIKYWKGSPLKFIEFNCKLFFQLKREKFKILHAHDLWVLPATVMAAFFAKKPVIYDVHEYVRGLEIFNQKKISGFIWKLAESIFIRFVRVIIVINDYHGRLLSQVYPNIPQPHILMNFPSLEMDKHYHQRDFNQRDKKAVYQGILKEGRNLRRVVESMNSVKDGLLEIIGYGDLENELKALVDNLNLNEKIIFTGKISWDKLFEETSAARTGVVLFEPDGLNYTYASPNKFFEYVNAGTPVIASDIPSFRDLIKQFEVGILVDHTSVSSISESIEKLLTDGKTWAKIHSQCLKARLEWNWERQEARLLKIYKDLLNEI